MSDQRSPEWLETRLQGNKVLSQQKLHGFWDSLKGSLSEYPHAQQNFSLGWEAISFGPNWATQSAIKISTLGLISVTWDASWRSNTTSSKALMVRGCSIGICTLLCSASELSRSLWRISSRSGLWVSTGTTPLSINQGQDTVQVNNHVLTCLQY